MNVHILGVFPGCPKRLWVGFLFETSPGAPAEQQVGASEKSLAIHSCKALDVPTGIRDTGDALLQ